MKSRSIKVSIISVVFFLILVMAYDLKVSAMTNLEIQNQQLLSSTGVNPLIITDFKAFTVSSENAGNFIILKTSSIGGVGKLRTRFTAFDGISWTTIKDYSTQSYAIWKPTKAGRYIFFLQIKDSSGVVVKKSIEYEITNPLMIKSLTGKVVKKTLNYLVTDPLTIKSFQSGKVSPQNVGTLIILKTEASGGIGILQSKFTVFDGTTLTTLKDYTMQGYVIWKPSKVGTYTINVQVKDITGKIETKSMTYVIAEPLVINSFTTGVTSPQILGNSITLSRTTSGGIGTVQTRFTAFDGARWIIIKDYSIVASALWTPTKAGTYTVYAYVKDTRGMEISKTLSYKLINLLVINSLTTNKVSPQNMGTAITIQSSAIGNGTLQYKYEIEKDGIRTLLKDYSTISTAVWTPNQTGSYKIIASLKDATGLIVTKEISYLININISQLYNMTSSLGWIYFINYNGKDLYDYSENGVRCAGLAINSSNFAVTLMKSTTKSTAIIKQTLSLALPTQYTKVYNIISAPCVDQTLTFDGKTVKIYKSNGYTVAQVCW